MKIYVNIPANIIAGGVESLYQLVDSINNNNGDCYIIWDDFNSSIMNIPTKYINYNIKQGFPVEDSNNNWIIYPEIWTSKLSHFKQINKSIWWLSVDNNRGSYQNFLDVNITHFFQSYYAFDYLNKNKTNNVLALFDYIPDYYINNDYDISKKENIVTYNPVKGKEFTDYIIQKNPYINFKPIINMSENEIIELLKISKVYIDFGHHPGRDRIPREAAILGNCIITNKKGSSKYYNDIPIPNNFKVDDLDSVGIIINECFNNFKLNHNNFKLYRMNIKNQKEQLNNLTKQYFSKNEK